MLQHATSRGCGTCRSLRSTVCFRCALACTIKVLQQGDSWLFSTRDAPGMTADAPIHAAFAEAEAQDGVAAGPGARAHCRAGEHTSPLCHHRVELMTPDVCQTHSQAAQLRLGCSASAIVQWIIADSTQRRGSLRLSAQLTGHSAQRQPRTAQPHNLTCQQRARTADSYISLAACL